MTVFIARRLVISFFVLLAATFIVYTLTALSGDPLADLRQDQTAQRDREDRRTRRADAARPADPPPLPQLARLGRRPGRLRRQPRRARTSPALLGHAVSATLQLVLAATVLAIIFGIMVGIVTALRQYTGFDYTVTFASFLFFSLPSFWIAVMLKQYAAIEFNNWLQDPASRWPSSSSSRWSPA